ncbi:MAG: DUF6159 family protein [Acidimicrobiia bacterium]
MTRFQTSWAIAKRSWAVLKSDKTLAWFPVLSFAVSLLVVGSIAGLIALMGIDNSATKDSLAPLGYVLIVVGYLALAFVQTYFLAALVAGADERLRGGNSTVKGAIEVANSRLHRLLPWAVITATVTVILNQLERQGVVGRIIGSLIGLAWSVVTFLTIPILVIEDIGVGKALTRSKDLLKQTWGENIIGQGGLGIVGFLAMIPGVLLVVVGAGLGTIGLVVFGAMGLAWILVSTVVVAALSGIYRTALYRFAATGQVPGDFDGVDFQGAFRPRRSLGGGFSGFSQN